MIERPFIILSDYNSLKRHLRNGNISNESNAVVFLKKERVIWTHGIVFGLDLSTVKTNVPSITDYASAEKVEQLEQRIEDSLSNSYINEIGSNVEDIITQLNGKGGVISQLSRLADKTDANRGSINALKDRIDDLENAEEKREHSKGFFSSPEALPTTDCEEGDWAIVDVNGIWYIYYYYDNVWASGEEYEKPDINLSEYVSKRELENKGYLTSIPDDYAKLSDIPEIQLGNYASKSWVENNYVGGEWLRQLKFITEDQLQAALNNFEVNVPTSTDTPEFDYTILDDYITWEELQALNYLTEDEIASLTSSIQLMQNTIDSMGQMESTINASVDNKISALRTDLQNQIDNIQPSSTTVPEDYIRHKIITESSYAALTQYEQNVVYLVIPDSAINNTWTFGGTFPITLQ